MSPFVDPKAWPEADYRKRVQEVFDGISARLEGVDPDQAECEQAFGMLSITFSDKTKLILSTQAAVRQIWVAARGTAYHFSFEQGTGEWLDDKGRPVELLAFVRKSVQDAIGTDPWQKK